MPLDLDKKLYVLGGAKALDLMGLVESSITSEPLLHICKIKIIVAALQ